MRWAVMVLAISQIATLLLGVRLCSGVYRTDVKRAVADHSQSLEAELREEARLAADELRPDILSGVEGAFSDGRLWHAVDDERHKMVSHVAEDLNGIVRSKLEGLVGYELAAGDFPTSVEVKDRERVAQVARKAVVQVAERVLDGSNRSARLEQLLEIFPELSAEELDHGSATVAILNGIQSQILWSLVQQLVMDPETR